MSRIRTVKPELFRHEELFDAELESGLPLRLAFIGLFTVADCEGRFRWKPRTLKLDVLPHDSVEFAAVLNALARHGFIQRYEVGGEVYGVIPSFNRHQQIQSKESERGSSIPPPPEQNNPGIVPEQSRNRTGTIPESYRNGTGTGTESQEKEEEKEEEEETSTISAREACATEKPSSPPSSNVLDSSRESRTEEAGRLPPEVLLLEVWNHVNPERPVRSLPPKRQQSVGTTLAFVAGNLGKPDWPKSPDDIPAWFADLFRYARDHDGYLRDRDFGFFMDADRLSGTVEGVYEPRH